ncbi:MAG: glycosyltransferase family 2 protein [Candidatus Omnitrophica bacterium]|nr:glycosyltransferase family 2 protein [Candidatus Omnitrophota bacterium]
MRNVLDPALQGTQEIGPSVSFKRLSVIIPVYNEAETIESVILEVEAVALDLEKELVIIDDGSSDGTWQKLQVFKDRVKLVQHPCNRGKGAAIKSGIRAASGDMLLIQDADHEYSPQDYALLIAPIMRGDAEFVMGSRFKLKPPRFFTKHGDPFFSHYIGNKVIRWLTNTLYGFQATDYEGCYKVFTRDVIEQTPIQANGFEFDNELICKLLRRRCRIVEVPIHYSPRSYHQGKKIRWQHGMRMVWAILKWRVARF